MQFLGTLQQVKTHTELLVQGLGVVANNAKTAAFGWTFRPEGADYHVPSGLDRVRHLANISCSFIYRG